MPTLEDEIMEAQELMASGDFSGAVKKFNKIIKSNPSSADAYFGKAEAGIADSSMSPDEIIACYKKALSIDSKNPMYWSSYAVYLIEQGKFDEAEGAYNKAAENDSDNAPYYYSEFGVEYAIRGPSSMRAFVEGKDLDDKMKEVIQKKEENIKKKALQYLLKAINVSTEDAKKLL
ncbi:MAG: tetratricopeptide repeat protein [Thermoplasmata archaeon]|nr:tetratricopeptide repeat protein [Thermoplasmata archaeon]